MANQKYFIRYSKIIYRVKRGDYPNTETLLYFLFESGFDINKRTLTRDFNAILELFDTEIVFDRSQKGYYVNQEDTDLNSLKLLETLDLFSSLNIVGKQQNIILFEHRKQKGTDQMYYIIDAIKNQKVLFFEHIKYHEQKITERAVEPYLLKESQGRWYLVANDKKDNKIKTFGLDRMSLLYTDNSTFRKPKDLDVSKMFTNCFGIINSSNPKYVKIQFFGVNAYYIKSYPLHHSQCVIGKNNKSITFSMRLSITDDFVMEIMKYGSSIKILEPLSLKKKILKEYKKAINFLS